MKKLTHSESEIVKSVNELEAGVPATGTVAPYFPESWLSSAGLVAQSTPE